jgi:DNA-binding SARP family transcriptional activator
MSSAPYRLSVLGPITIRGDDDASASSRVTQPLHLALLCYLALARPRGLQSRDTLIELLWPEHDAARGRQALRNALYGVRRRLGDKAVVSAGTQLVGLNTAVVSCDALELERGLPWRVGEAPTEEDFEPMQGFHLGGAPEFDHWLSGERDRLRALAMRHSGPTGVRTASADPVRRPYASDVWVLHAGGHYLFLRSAHGGSPEDLLRSRDYFERALALDAEFAPALAGLSNFYAVAARRGMLTPFQEHFSLAIEVSQQALALDPGLAVPHVHLGVKALYLDDDFERAGIDFETAVRKDPAYAEGHRFYGVWLGLAGRPSDAIHEMEEAAALEPDVPHLQSSLGAARMTTGDHVGAEETLRRTLRLDPRHGAARERLIRLLEDHGRYEEAQREPERPPALPFAEACRAALDESGSAYERCVRDALRQEADALEERILEGAPASVNDLFAPPMVRLVELYARSGDAKRARRWAMEAKARRPALARWLASIPGLQEAIG